MSNISNKASICSIVHIEIIDFLKKPDAEQAEIKNKLNLLINRAVIDIAHNNRAILNVADGTLIACIGPLEDALEDALLIAQIVRDEILESNSLTPTPLYVRFGINLGSVQAPSDLNGKPSVVGESMVEAKRMMSFAEPNQILVSRPYYEMASELSQEISQLFQYHDMHASEQEIYAVKPLKEYVPIVQTSSILTKVEAPSITTSNLEPQSKYLNINNINWSYVLLSLLVMFAAFALVKLVSTRIEPTIVYKQPAIKEPLASSSSTLPAKTEDKFLLPNESLEKATPQAIAVEKKPAEDEPVVDVPVVGKPVEKQLVEKKLVVDEPVTSKTVEKKVKKKTAQKKVIQKPVTETKTETPKAAEEKPVASKVDKGVEKDKTGWETFKDNVKQGAERPCSQAEIAMNQCR